MVSKGIDLSKDATVVFTVDSYKVAVRRLYENEPVNVWVYKKSFTKNGKKFWLTRDGVAIPAFPISKRDANLREVQRKIELFSGYATEVWRKLYGDVIWFEKAMSNKDAKFIQEPIGIYKFLNPKYTLDSNDDCVYLNTSLHDNMIAIKEMTGVVGDLTTKQVAMLITCVLLQGCNYYRYRVLFKNLPDTPIKRITNSGLPMKITTNLYGFIINTIMCYVKEHDNNWNFSVALKSVWSDVEAYINDSIEK